MAKQYIAIHINSDLPPVVYEIDTEEGEAKARDALKDAGLEYGYVWVSTGDSLPYITHRLAAK